MICICYFPSYKGLSFEKLISNIIILIVINTLFSGSTYWRFGFQRGRLIGKCGKLTLSYFYRLENTVPNRIKRKVNQRTRFKKSTTNRGNFGYSSSGQKLLNIGTGHFITNWDKCYKLGQLLQIGAVQL